MIREAELFLQAETVLVEVLGRIRAGQWRIVMPPTADLPRTARPLTIRQAVRRYARDNALLPELLAGRSLADIGDTYDGDLLGPDPHASVAALSEAACAAAEKVTDATAPVDPASGESSVSDYLWRSDIARCFLAHDVARHLGSRACPFTEELARGMWEGTWPVAQRWRDAGLFSEPLALPPDVSWRDRFLLCAGRDPHPDGEHR
ncbi:hypothetical protein [Pseudonocardia sp.]|uniref:hypothetical protein n=1 Tax=Pseudonocardia sp. TaxID=60912 RepID=UPI003D0A93F7